jgi:micrococcal nuclease
VLPERLDVRAFSRLPRFGGLAVLLLIMACSSPSVAVAPPDAPVVPAEQRASATPPAASYTPGPGAVAAPVVRVVDGDTIVVRLDGRQQRVRYTGMNTPESVDPRRPVQCFGKEAAVRNRQLVEGKAVWLEKDVSETDRFGRLLRYVSVDGVLVNAALVAEGYAHAVTYPPDVRYAERFRALERGAREARRGLWGGC